MNRKVQFCLPKNERESKLSEKISSSSSNEDVCFYQPKLHLGRWVRFGWISQQHRFSIARWLEKSRRRCRIVAGGALRPHRTTVTRRRNGQVISVQMMDTLTAQHRRWGRREGGQCHCRRVKWTLDWRRVWTGRRQWILFDLQRWYDDGFAIMISNDGFFDNRRLFFEVNKINHKEFVCVSWKPKKKKVGNFRECLQIAKNKPIHGDTHKRAGRGEWGRREREK